jgi:hypothetical protein
MTRFTSAREAKEFLVAKIAEEAQREGVPLSEVERKMLCFSETGWTLPDIAEVSDQFDRECNREEYEKKIAKLIRNARRRTRKEDKQEFDKWSAAVRRLSKEDHYVLVMTQMAGISVGQSGNLPRALIAVIVFGFFAPVALAYLASQFGLEFTRGSVGFFGWVIATTAVVIYGLLRVFLGRDRAEELFDKITGLFLGGS